MDPTDLSKRLTTVLGATAAVCYACGYLSLRARSFALGIDPAYQLIDQVYIFNGAKFILSVLSVLILTSPIIVLVELLSRSFAERVSGRVLIVFEALGVSMMLGLVLISFNLVVRQASVLLEASPNSAESEASRAVRLALERAILGEDPGRALLIFSVIVVIAVIAAIWKIRGGLGFDRYLDVALVAALALLLFLLPIYHGVFLADRRVRVLTDVPPEAGTLQPPVAIVDRTAEQVALYGMDNTGHRTIVTVDTTALNGLRVSAIESLATFSRRLNGEFRAAALFFRDPYVGDLIWAQADPGQPDDDTLPELTGENVGFFAILMEFFGMTLQNANALGGYDEPGELWTADMDSSGIPSNRRRVGSLDDVTWPVVGLNGHSLVVLQDSQIVVFEGQGASPRVVHEGGEWMKLIGVTPDESILGLVRFDRSTRPAVLRPNGAIEIGAPASTLNEEKAIARLSQEARTYENGDILFVDRSERGGRGLDVFLRTAGRTINLSDCGDDYCNQPSLSPDRRQVVFVRVSM